MSNMSKSIVAALIVAATCTGCLINDPPRFVSGSTSADIVEDGVVVGFCEQGGTGTPSTEATVSCVEFGDHYQISLIAFQLLEAYDPVILEVPATVNHFTGTLGGFVNGAVVQVPLEITAGLASIPIDPKTTLTAEPGMQLVIVGLPPGVVPSSYGLHLSFSPPNGVTSVKALFALKVQAGGQTYYPLLFPCVSDLASVPSISSNTTLSLAQVASLIASVPSCNGKVYDFSGVAAPTPVDVIEFYNAGLDHYFITWVTNEIHDLDTGVHPGWARTGKSFKTYNMSRPGTSPVCRFYIPPALGDSHFFGRGTTECNDTAQKFPQLILEDPMFMFMYLPAAGTCPANTTEVHRAFDNRPDANHRYTTDPAVLAQMQARGWVAEGDGPDLVVMCAPL